MAKKKGSSSSKGGSDKVGVKNAGSNKPASPPAEHWTDEPEEHDYPAAASYLSLVCEHAQVQRLVDVLKSEPVERHLAKDLLRASGLTLLPVDNVHVASDLAKVQSGEKLSPVLLVRGDMGRDVPLTIADGYHRVCASYHLDENAPIPCQLADHGRAGAAPAAFEGTPVSTRRPGGPVTVN
jgi:hypothetical protein